MGIMTGRLIMALPEWLGMWESEDGLENKHHDGGPGQRKGPQPGE
jgi:hypothetical protein